MVTRAPMLGDLFVATKGAQSLTVMAKAVQISRDFVRTRFAYDTSSTFFDGSVPNGSFKVNGRT
jgi:hypothetical protein